MIRLLVLLTSLLLTFDASAATQKKPTTPQEVLGYSIGLSIGQNVKRQEIAGNRDMIVAGFKTALFGEKPLIDKQIMQTALLKYEHQLQAKHQQKATAIINAHAKQLYHDKNDPVMANPKGQVTLVEFFDYQCIHCRRMGDRLAELAKKDPQLRIVFKEFPIFGKNSIFAARAALATLKQSRDLYWKFHQALLSSSKALSNEEVLKIAKDTGLNMDKLKEDMKSPTITRALANNWNLAQAVGVHGTPGFIIAPTTATHTKQGQPITPVFIPGEVPVKTLALAIENVQNQIPGLKKFIFEDLKPTPETQGVWPGI